MNLLLDTHLLLWAAATPDRLSREATELILDKENRLFFSAASMWEITIKRGLGRADFRVDPALLRRGLVENGYDELPVTSTHAMAVGHLPPIHKDPFDRMLVAQAESEGLLLLTNDNLVAGYPGPIRLV
ncbi:MAG TPA: type II toxin-antitoxin system VapC family toxin [Gammaproteobacteria bacterium]|jgi:PIN domain nuclease of toxin-antitoxin system